MLTIEWNMDAMSNYNRKHSKEVFPVKSVKRAIEVLGKRQTSNIKKATMVIKGVLRDRTYNMVKDGKAVDPSLQLSTN